jgi:BirA family transcriptional regulator, biotin operon repressor / biotin---[acetyl-CoA-carboxylase] ligase
VTIAAPFLSRRERFASVGSTNDVVRDWLAEGTPEICLAIADEQTAGRGREGRTWLAASGTTLLFSVGFRPTWLAPQRTWRLAAIVGLAMAGAGETVAGLADGTIRQKWPNDLVVEAAGGWRKVAGVLGESVGLGTAEPRVVVGIGTNVNWRRDDFPAAIADTMTSLLETRGDGQTVDADELLDAFLARLEALTDALRADVFDDVEWRSRQVTTGRVVALHGPDGREEHVRAIDVDAETGALIVVGDADTRPRSVFSGEIQRLRLPRPWPGV